jgi:hypothetical protein
MEILEDWLLEIKKSRSYSQLYQNCGVYDGLNMFFEMNDCKRGNLFQKINDSLIFDFWGGDFRPDFYNKKFEKIKRFGIGNKAQFYFETPVGEKIVFPQDSDFSNIGNEFGFEYDTRLQLYFHGDFQGVRKGFIFLLEEFVIPEKIATYVIAGNSKDEKFKKFSYQINGK